MSINEKTASTSTSNNVNLDDKIGLNSCKNFSLNRKFAKYLDYSFGGPTMNMYENLSQVVIELELVGIGLEQVKLDFTPKNELVVSGEIIKDPKYEHYKVLIDERAIFKFERRIFITPHANIADYKADFKDGLLTIIIPKHGENNI